MTKQKFADLPAPRRALIVGLAAVQIGLFVAAQRDLTLRRPDQVRGSKTRWRLLAFINFFGPLAYFRWGRLPD